MKLYSKFHLPTIFESRDLEPPLLIYKMFATGYTSLKRNTVHNLCTY